LPLADGDADFSRCKREKGVESPNPAEKVRIIPPSPCLLEMLEGSRDGDPVPTIIDVEQLATTRTTDEHLADIVGCPAWGGDTSLKCVHPTTDAPTT